MRKTFLRLAAASALVSLAIAPAFSQGSYNAPRTPDGKPDLQGIWEARNTAYASLEDHSAAMGMRAGRTVIVDPADGKIPYKPEARAKRDENFKNRATADPMNRCFLPGAQRTLYIPYPFQIFQTPKYIAMLSEFGHSSRTIYTSGKPYEGVDYWQGDSRGRWEGDTLVVDVTGNNEMTWFDMAGDFHSDEMKAVERFTRTGADTLRYEATITDPKVYTRPWTIRMNLYRNTEPDAQIYEYECHVYLEEQRGRATKPVEIQAK